MSMELLDEHEQGERVRRWIADNATAMIGGLGIGLVLLFAWQRYQHAGVESRGAAATQYQSLVAAEGDIERRAALAEQISGEFSDTGYAVFAALERADDLLAAKDYDGAVSALAAVESQSVAPAFADLVALRRARLELARGNTDAARASVALIKSESFAGMSAELEGDIESAAGNRDTAYAAYQRALEKLDSGSPVRQLVEFKSAEVAPPDAASRSATPKAEPSAMVPPAPSDSSADADGMANPDSGDSP